MTGWSFHYVIGIISGAIRPGLVYAAGAVPHLPGGLIFGFVTLAAPFLFIQPQARPRSSGRHG